MPIKFVIDPCSLYKSLEVTRALRAARSDDVIVLPPGYCKGSFIVPPGIIVQGDSLKVNHDSCSCCKENK